MLRDWLITPYLNPSTPQEQSFNRSKKSARSSVERCIGALKRKWHILHGEMRLNPSKVCKTTLVCFMLFNKCRHHGYPVDAPLDTSDAAVNEKVFMASKAVETIKASHPTHMEGVANLCINIYKARAQLNTCRTDFDVYQHVYTEPNLYTSATQILHTTAKIVYTT